MPGAGCGRLLPGWGLIGLRQSQVIAALGVLLGHVRKSGDGCSGLRPQSVGSSMKSGNGGIGGPSMICMHRV